MFLALSTLQPASLTSQNYTFVQLYNDTLQTQVSRFIKSTKPQLRQEDFQ